MMSKGSIPFFQVVTGIGVLLLLGYTLIQAAKVPIPEDLNDYDMVEGQVEKVKASKNKDIVFYLEGHKESYYINRGLERDINYQKLAEELKGKTIAIYYPRHWATPFSTNHHLSRITMNDEIIFDEIQ